MDFSSAKQMKKSHMETNSGKAKFGSFDDGADFTVGCSSCFSPVRLNTPSFFASLGKHIRQWTRDVTPNPNPESF
jgi:hypothetical protein